MLTQRFADWGSWDLRDSQLEQRLPAVSLGERQLVGAERA